MWGTGLVTLPGRGSPATDSLEEGLKEEKLRLPYQMTQSALVWASCMTCELLGLFSSSLCRLLLCTDGNSMYQALGMNMIWAGRVALICKVWQSCQCALGTSSGRSAGWLTELGPSGGIHHLDVLVFPLGLEAGILQLRLLGRASSHSGLPSFTRMSHLRGCSVARKLKIAGFYTLWWSCNHRGIFSRCWCTLLRKLHWSWQRSLQVMMLIPGDF